MKMQTSEKADYTFNSCKFMDRHLTALLMYLTSEYLSA